MSRECLVQPTVQCASTDLRTIVDLCFLSSTVHVRTTARRKACEGDAASIIQRRVSVSSPKKRGENIPPPPPPFPKKAYYNISSVKEKKIIPSVAEVAG